LDRQLMAARLKKLRGDKTQFEVAEAMHIAQSTYAMYETGQRVPRDDVKVKIAKYFGKSIKYIFFDENTHL